MQVQFHFQTQVILKQRKVLKQFISNMFRLEKVQSQSLSIVFCTDKFLLDINQQYLQHNYFTDIITFTLSPTLAPIEGEIYISTETVYRNAKDYDVSTREELHRVIFHGVLHLCGYLDSTLKQKKLMRQKEDAYLELYFTT